MTHEIFSDWDMSMNQVGYEAPFGIVGLLYANFHGLRRRYPRSYTASQSAWLMGYHLSQRNKENQHDLPKLRLLLNKLGHQALALFVIHHDNLLAAVLEQLLSAHKVMVLTDYHTLHLVENACASAHVAGRQGGVHGGALVGGGGETARVFESGHLSLICG